MGKPYYGSIDFTLLLEAVHAKHSAFVRTGKENHVYVNITVWENDEADKYGNTHAIQVSPKEGAPDDNKDGRFYIGNIKPSKKKEPKPVTDTSTIPTDDDLPF